MCNLFSDAAATVLAWSIYLVTLPLAENALSTTETVSWSGEVDTDGLYDRLTTRSP